VTPAFGDATLGLATALGAGLLIGLERERRKGRGPRRNAAGIRSFTIAALAGALAQVLAQPLLVALGAAAVVALAAIAYWASRRPSPPASGAAVGETAGSDDPGLTTELALVVTYLVGVLAVQQPALGGAAAVVVAGLLAARDRLHRFATKVLSEAELHDLLLLAALALVAVPLLPAAPQPWLAGLAPRGILWVMLVILLLQALGHIALRVFGARLGLALSGFMAGFVSSTATVASLGTRSRALPEASLAERRACAAGATLSTAATWVQAIVMLLALAPPAAAALAPAAAAALAVTALAAWLMLPRADAAPAAPVAPTRPLRLREAALLALWLSFATLAVGWAQRGFGNAGALIGTAVAALADAHAPIAALGALQAAGQAEPAMVRDGALLAIASNSLMRVATAFVAGGRAYGVRIAAGLAGAALAAAVAYLVIR
jgi:uncharacterized membrane protein (DUF4010 family)